MHAHALVHVEQSEDLIEDRHQDGAAADAENARQKSRHDACPRDRRGKTGDLAPTHIDQHEKFPGKPARRAACPIAPMNESSSAVRRPRD
jgi:hypothetical protein